VEKKIYDSIMNLGKVMIENPFNSLKAKWQILKILIFKVDRGTHVMVIYCVLHNYYEIWGAYIKP
jgi:hypothetical protein